MDFKDKVKILGERILSNLQKTNTEGATKLYPMSDFDIRHDLDIRKGYLNGRFGAIPFLGNFKDLNWKGDEATKL